MYGPESSCRRWMQKNKKDGPCRRCFTPSPGGRCIDFKVTQPEEGAVEPQADVIQAVIEPVVPPAVEPDGPVRQEINIRAECSKPRPLLESDKDKLRCCTLCVAQEQNLKPNLCSAECRPLKTSLHLNEWTKRPLPKPDYKHSVVLDETTIAGRCFPCKFRLKRLKNKCLDCGRTLYFRYPIAPNSDVLLLKNCCDVEVYPMLKVENMNNVRVGKISGVKKFSRSLLKERSECKMHNLAYYRALEPQPEPEPERLSARKSSKRSSKKGKKGKGKKKKK
ncbi:hypothetical protein KR009_006469 [Drosophila setifemur]|nr:hypothetical protein KR009_006469 [Drosophila setifemur]